MQTLNYIGCKHTLLNTIKDICYKEMKPEWSKSNAKKKKIVDIFAGTGTVGFGFSQVAGTVIANDLEYYSYVINFALLRSSYTPRIEKYIELLNKLDGVKGLIYKHFSPNDESDRMFFTPENAQKADKIRQQIETELKHKKISESEYYFLLASLLVSIDKVANTTSVYGAYLKKFKASAIKPLILKPIHKIIINNKSLKQNKVFCGKAEELFDKHFEEIGEVDLVYMDPPYNHRQYSGNYSQLNYIACYDPKKGIKGVTGLLKDKNTSAFCSKSKVYNAFEMLFESVYKKTKYIALSYNDEGLLSFNELKELLSRYGNVKLYTIKYGKFKAQMSVDKKHVNEYIWIIDCKGKKGFYKKIETTMK